ncbi:MAG: ABC transporter substrate-binding protein [Gammaproteobacteria bacterium]|nr:ABC transporter substrate-binding protein [Gammaproteobacteria bacterium]
MWRKSISALLYLPPYLKILAGTLGWLVFISFVYYQISVESPDRKIVKMGYMPVITNLAAPILDHVSENGDGIRYKALKFASFAEMAESLRNGQIDVAFMIAPLSIVLRQQDEDVKVVYIGNRHESTMVTRKDLNVKSLRDLIGKTIAVPMRFSGHNISILNIIEEQNLTGKIKVVEMNPPDMASALSAGALDAYYVGEPFAAQTIKSGHSEKFFYVEDVWDKFICNLVVVRNDLIQQQPDMVQEIVRGAVRSGFWASQNIPEATKIASKYWNQPVDLLEYAFTTPQDRILFDQYIPKESEMKQMAEMMKQVGLLENTDVSGLVDDRFARAVKVEEVIDVESILNTDTYMTN